MNKEKFDITGMTCSACSTRVEQCVRKLPGVSEVSVNLLKNSMVVSYDEHSLDTAGPSNGLSYESTTSLTNPVSFDPSLLSRPL